MASRPGTPSIHVKPSRLGSKRHFSLVALADFQLAVQHTIFVLRVVRAWLKYGGIDSISRWDIVREFCVPRNSDGVCVLGK